MKLLGMTHGIISDLEMTKEYEAVHRLHTNMKPFHVRDVSLHDFGILGVLNQVSAYSHCHYIVSERTMNRTALLAYTKGNLTGHDAECNFMLVRM